MLRLYRRHQKHCLLSGRQQDKCSCRLWVDGRTNRERIHKSLRTTDLEKADEQLSKLKTGANCQDVKPQIGPITLNQAWLRFMADLDVRKLHPATVRKYRLLQKQMEEFAAHKGTRFLDQLDTERFVRNRLFLYTAKTGVPVHIIIPEFVLHAN
jgi:hypothetical protein